MTYFKNQMFTNRANSTLIILVAHFETYFETNRNAFLVKTDRFERWLDESQLDNLISDYGYKVSQITI